MSRQREFKVVLVAPDGTAETRPIRMSASWLASALRGMRNHGATLRRIPTPFGPAFEDEHGNRMEARLDHRKAPR